MSVIVLGVNHRSVPLDLLERMTIAPERLPKALHAVVGCDHVNEAVVLSTCNRTEVYVQAERFHAAVGEVRDVLADLAFLAPEAITDHLYTFHDAAAVAHLFTVAAGLDSAVLGESEILGQVKKAFERAVAEEAAGPAMNMLFRHALETGKRARTETGIARHTASVASSAVALASQRLGSLTDRRVLVLGAGEVGEAMVASLAAAGAAEVLVANRTAERATALAERVGGRAVRLHEVVPALRQVDVLLTSTGATSIVVDDSDLEPVLAARGGRPLLIVDVAMPRDVDPSVGALPGVTLLDMDDLRAHAEAGLGARRREVAKVRDLVDEEVSRYREAASARSMAPLVGAVRERVEALRMAEVERLGRRLSDAEREAVETVTRGVAAKLLHEPTVRLKSSAGTLRGERLADAMRELFDL